MTAHTLRTMVDISFTDGEEMYDNQYEVAGTLEVLLAGNGWANEYRFHNLQFSAPDCDLDTSRAIPWLLPSSAELEAEDALMHQLEQDRLNSGEQYERDDR